MTSLAGNADAGRSPVFDGSTVLVSRSKASRLAMVEAAHIVELHAGTDGGVCHLSPKRASSIPPYLRFDTVLRINVWNINTSWAVSNTLLCFPMLNHTLQASQAPPHDIQKQGTLALA